jgi:serine O-acetyltransferase
MNALLETLAKDKVRYRLLGGIRRNLGFWMVATHRLNHFAQGLDPSLLSRSLLAGCRGAAWLWRSVWGVDLSESASIGPGFCLIHPRDVLIGRTHIGADCLVFHEVTIEGGAAGPRIGDRVDVYVGAKVLGDVEIGDDAKIGANCVVQSDVEAGCNIVTAASRVIPAAVVGAFGPRRAAADVGTPTGITAM